MFKPKSNKLNTEVSILETPTVFFERMEPRILLSADALSGLVTSDPFNDDAANTALDINASVDLITTSYFAETDDAGSDSATSDNNLYDHELILGFIGDNQENDDNITSLDTLSAILGESDSGSASRQEIIFIDAATPDYDELLSGIDTDAADTDYQVFILQSDRDGVEQITEILARFDDVDAVHLVSHGNEQGVQLGDAWLGQDSLSAYADSLSAWSNTLSEEADILIYGCNLAATDSGQEFISDLAKLTDADVAASDDLTGADILGGDWELEYSVGVIDSSIAFNVQSWNGLLATTFTVNTVNDTVDVNLGDGVAEDAFGNTSLRAAIMEANALAGLDTIEFNIGGGGVQTIQPASILPDITDAVILDATTQPGFAGTPIIELSGSSAGAGDGLTLAVGSDGSTISGLVINRFDGDGIHIASDNNIIETNYIGTNVTGDTDLGNTLDGIHIEAGSSNNTIGGSSSAARNVVSGNDDDGITVAGSGTLIQGNYVGTDASGTAALGNTDDGIVIFDDASDITVGGNAAGEGNIISANGSDGIQIGSTTTTVSNITIQGNLIGTDVTGTSGLANIQTGIDIEDGQNILIGGAAANAGNTIAFNGQRGIEMISTATNTSILTNSIYANAGLGIDWGIDNVTPNDSGEQNYPVLTSAATNGTGNITIDGTLNSAAGTTFRIEFFASAVEDGAGYGEGETYLGFTTVTTDGAGDATFSTPLSATIAVGQFITATATEDLGGNTYGNTSEFAQNVSAVIAVNNTPVATNLSSTSNYIEDDAAVAITDIVVSDADSGEIITATLTLADTSTGSLSANDSASYDSGTGVWTITDTVANVNQALANLMFNPTTDNDLNTTIGVSIDDGDEDASGPLTGTINLNVTAINDAPVAVNDANALDGAEDSTTGTLNATLLSNDSDLDGDGISITAIEGTALTGGVQSIAVTNGTVNVDALDNITFTADANYNGAASFTYTISDGSLIDTATVSGTISAVNDVPVANNDAFTVNEGSTTTLNLAGNDTDVDGTLDLSSIVITGAATNGSIVVNADGTVDYTHDGSETLADSFSYTILDNSGAASNTGTVNITVTPVNDVPVANNDAFTVNEASTTTLNLAGNDTDVDGAIDLTSIVITAAPANGSIVVNADGTVDYTHDGSETLADSFSYTILDNSGAVSNTATVNITVTPVNDVPVVNNDAFTVNEASTTTLNLAGNDTDADDGLDLTSIVITGAPVNGSIVVNADGTVDYTHDGSATVADSFSYTVVDNSGAVSNTGTVNITVTPVNDVPLANNDAFTVNEASTMTLNLAGNDTDADDGLDLTSIVIIAAPTNGAIVVNADGTVDYTHDGSETQADSFSYTILDNNGAVSNTATVNITVTPVNDVPVANNDAFTVYEASTTTLNLAGNDTDVDGSIDLTSIVITGAPANGSIVVNADGTVNYTHNGSATVADSFSYTILDNSGAVSNTGTINLNVMAASVLAELVATETDVNLGTPDTSNTEDTSSTGDDEKPVKATVDEDVLNATNEVVFDSNTFTGGIGARVFLTLPALYQADNEIGERDTIIRDNDTSAARKLDISTIDRLRSQFTGFDGPLQLIATDSFISKLDDAREKITMENRSIDMVVGGSMSLSAGLSVGYAIWLARSGVLMSGLLSSMPAWAFIDPLPVLASMGAKDDEDDESLESMVEKKDEEKDEEKDDDK